jgi:hypothetical protein
MPLALEVYTCSTRTKVPAQDGNPPVDFSSATSDPAPQPTESPASWKRDRPAGHEVVNRASTSKSPPLMLLEIAGHLLARVELGVLGGEIVIRSARGYRLAVHSVPEELTGDPAADHRPGLRPLAWKADSRVSLSAVILTCHESCHNLMAW